MFAAVAITMGGVAVLLQLRRVLNKNTLGVSSTTWTALTIMNAGWAAFYLTIDQPYISLASAVFFPATTTIAVLSARNKGLVLSQNLIGAAIAATVMYLATPAGEVLITIFASLSFLPQLNVTVKAYREKTSLDGISLSSWTWTTIVTMLWLAQGVVFGEPAMLIVNTLLLVSCVGILWITFTQPSRAIPSPAQLDPTGLN
jgi:uncharacterized protein with PQ loop repeat